jgi:hypothetical protein
LKQGRRGDPRMHKAVVARLKNPKLSLSDALKIGGFDVSAAEDDQGVTLSQRKNQLSRRLRIFRRQSSSGLADCPVAADEQQQQQSKPPKTPTGPMQRPQQQTIIESIEPGLINYNLNNKSSDNSKEPSSAVHLQHSMDDLTNSTAGPTVLKRLPPPPVIGIGNIQNISNSATFTWGAAPCANEVTKDARMNVSYDSNSDTVDKNADERDYYISCLWKQLEVQDQLLKNFQQNGSLNSALVPKNSPLSYSGKSHPRNSDVAMSRDPPISTVAMIPSGVHQQLSHDQGLGSPSQPATTPQDQYPQNVGGSDETKQKRLSEDSDNSVMQCNERQNESRKRLRQQQHIGVKVGHSAPYTNTSTDAPFSIKHTQRSSHSVDPMKMQMALTLYNSEISAVIQRCMATAGFSPAEIMENHPTYVLLASKAMENEIHRVQRLRKLVFGEDTSSINIPWNSFSTNSSRNIDSTPPALTKDNNKCEYNISSLSNYSNENTDESHQTCPNTSNEMKHDEKKYLDVRHMHRLMGRCGHQAIVHYPPGGRPHVDFVVGDRIECYQNISPTNLPAEGEGRETVWPSRYRCAELQCVDGGGSRHDICSMFLEEGSDAPCKPIVQDDITPSLLDTSVWENVDEWNFDFLEGSSDETLLGLIELGKSVKGGSGSSSNSNEEERAENLAEEEAEESSVWKKSIQTNSNFENVLEKN